MRGFLDGNKILEHTMKKFLEEHKHEFDKLAIEHIKKIKLIKEMKLNK